MHVNYGRDLDLNLLRVFVVVADSGSVTQAAAQLYLTQPAVSAALRRLTTAIGAPLFTRRGRGLALTSRGERLLSELRPHLLALVDAALSTPVFDPATSDRSLRVGLSDTTETWMLPRLLRELAREAPRMRLIVSPVQFRTVGGALATRRIDVAVTVADELPRSVRRRELFHGAFVCLHDPRHSRLPRRLTERAYFERDHVIVSYNGDLRGVVEDALHKQRRVRCSVSSFANLGAIVDGTALLATVPEIVAAQIRLTRPHLETTALPFPVRGAPMELLWPEALDDDDACRFLRAKITSVVRKTTGARRPIRDRAP
ncbi:MAG: LysR family transcriptional regulator [Labilithrix sp.]|nr:LysR family transcriptional regulator [Labilithrix sp.]MCW5834788.1 LysR family transcriptional regulator [Labilithrix sp.]